MAIQMSLEWSCTQCTLYNPGGCAACEACGSPAPKSAAVDLLAEGAGENAHPCMPTPAPAAMEQLIAGQLERQNQRQSGLRPSIAEHEVSVLSFAVRYELEVLLCAGAIARNALCTGFLERLACCTIGLATRALRMMAVGGGECSDPLSAFEQCISASTAATKACFQLPSIHAKDGSSTLEVYRVAVTPTGVVALPVSVERSNRTLRDVHGIFGSTDRMVRVAFTADDAFTPISAKRLSADDVARIASTLSNGFRLCGRKYAMLGFSTSQLKQGSCWFFAAASASPAAADTDGDLPCLDANDIRGMMGDFSSIHHSPAKVAARMGQCLSTTVPHLYLEEKGTRPAGERLRDGVCLWAELPDVERNGYVFSDGNGTGSPALFRQVAERFGLARMPSALQIRLGGVKGMISLDTRLAAVPGEKEIAILHSRPSMAKFASRDRRVEVCEVSRWRPGRLNKQVILLLLTRGVPAGAFLDLFETETRRLLTAPHDAAYDRTSGGEGGSEVLTIVREVLSAGLYATPLAEPWCSSILHAMQRQRIAELRSKCSLNVELSALLFGIMDERAVLSYGEVFVRRSDTGAVVEGDLFVVKMPCLQPGDVLRLRAVDRPELRAADLFDVLVFPQLGPRPHPNETSGGDLDGDKFLVCWDPRLLPPQPAPPADYRAPHAVVEGSVGQLAVDGPGWIWGAAAGSGIPLVDCGALAKWFVAYLSNQNLGRLSNAHMAWADQSPLGANDWRCIKLAHLCSEAVDYQKSGVPATFPDDLKPRGRPDFMDGDPLRAYPSNRVLGHIFRRAGELLAGKDSSQGAKRGGLDNQPTVDPRLLIEGFESHLAEAMRLREVYCVRLAILLDSYGIESEAELLAGRPHCRHAHVASHSRGQFDDSQVSESIASLIQDTRQAFDNEVDAALFRTTGQDYGGSSSADAVVVDDEAAKVRVAKRLASACLHVCYGGTRDSHPLRYRSFPWIAAHRWLLDIVNLPPWPLGSEVMVVADRQAEAACMREDEEMARRLQDEETRMDSDFELASAMQAELAEPAGRPDARMEGLARPRPIGLAAGLPHPVALDGMNIGMNMNFRDAADAHNPAGLVAVVTGRKSVHSLAILNAIEYYETRGHQVMAFLPEWCLDGGRDGTRHANRHELLWPLLNRGVLVLTPARMDDDNWIIDHAQRTAGCKILTNDHLESHIARGKVSAAWRDARVIKFAFVHNELRPMNYERK